MIENKQELKIYLGKSIKNNEKIFWDPYKELNPHLMTLGKSGTGKTETLRALMFELNKKKINNLSFDFHNDFRDIGENLLETSRFNLHPLEIELGEKPIDVVYKLSDMIGSLFKLGDIQKSIIRASIKEFYHNSGIKNLNEIKEDTNELLPFIKFKKILLEQSFSNSELKRLYSKIEILFDVQLFTNEKALQLPFKKILNGSNIFNLNDFPSDEIKAFITDLLLKKLISYLYKNGKQDKIWLYVFIDEAHRMAYTNSPIGQLLRESRKYGVGLILASQRPTDFSETTVANVSALLAFKSELNKDAVYLSKYMRIDKESFQKIKNIGECFISLNSLTGVEKIKILQVNKREGYTLIEKDEEIKLENTKKIYAEEMLRKKRLENLKINLEKNLEENKRLQYRLKKLEKDLKTKDVELIKSKEKINNLKDDINQYKSKYYFLQREKG